MGRPDDGTPLRAVRKWVAARLEDGDRCPACDQFAKRYRRKLNSGMATALVKMYRHSGTAWIDIRRELPEIQQQGGEMAKLRYWGLVEKHSNQQSVWRVTEFGRSFSRGAARVPRYVLIYNDECLGFDGEEITVRDAFKDPFDYDELMSS